ncbi:stage V sporulation protein E [Clostridium cellulovorans]|uniref:Probable peptidoglycan glycosyltransferase FtsW n=1 Tax=Clostridium cellulovorans (strain ATCC 35296 / DSM 3052 / OCM 3 / 743B) TaxID=573061 RepID=D9SKK2_CLOC7|nr:stage V sporulation protein E [Clostridium cellulovorans]ADL51498.1 stage V sporulation protein E [Clostridium cellulovorans 743B]
MQKIKKKVEVDFTLLSVLLLLVFIGVVMVFSASSYVALNDPAYNDMYYFLKKQGTFAVVGLATMFYVLRIDYHKYKKWTLVFMLLTIPINLAVFAFDPVKGAQRWIRFGPMNLQPSEIAKYVMVLFLAHSISRKGDKMQSFLYGVLPYLGVAGAYAALVLIQKSLSITMVILGTTLILLFVGGVKKKYFAIVLGLVFTFGVVFILIEPYRLERLLSFTDPFADPRGDGYQLIQSWYALASGGLLGQGLGQSRQKCFFIPEPHNDFIFSIIGEELGLVGCLFILFLFSVLIYRGIRIASKAKDTYGSLLAVGIISVIAIQTVINIAVVTGAMPVTGVPMPFISYGGSSLVINLASMGILLNISSQTEK